MTETPVSRLILNLGIPTTISMLITSIYNMADTYFVGTLGESAQAATGILFTVQAIMQGLAFMLGHGAGTYVSRALADRDADKATMYISTSFFTGMGLGLVIGVLGLAFLRPLVHFLGSTDTIAPYAMDYGFWVFLAAPTIICSLILNNGLRYEGKAFYAMIGLTAGGLLNILGDYILVMKLGMGVYGAGLATAASQLVSEGVSVVLGSYGSGVSIAASDTFKQAGIPAIGVTCTNPNVTAGNSHYFRICFLDPFQGTVLANYAAKELKAVKAYCLGENGNEYDQGLVTFFKQAFEKAGGTVVTDSFPKDNSDFSSYLNKAKDQGCDVIFAPVSIAYSTQIVNQAASLNISLPMLGSDTWDDNMVLQAAKGKDVKVFVSTFYAEGGNQKFDDGIKAYINGNADAKTTNGGDDTVSAVTAMGYDVYYVALEALKAAGSTDPAKVMEALPGVTYDGVSGHIAFDDTGDAIRDTAYIKTIDAAAGAWTFVTQQKAS